MGIKSTSYVTRGVAENRVQEIINKIINAEWVDLYTMINEDDYFMNNLINYSNDNYDEFIGISKFYSGIDKWPNRFLEQFMDRRGIRFSQFENYIIE